MTSEEWLALTRKFLKSNHAAEKKLHAHLKDELLPTVLDGLQKREWQEFKAEQNIRLPRSGTTSSTRARNKKFESEEQKRKRCVNL